MNRKKSNEITRKKGTTINNVENNDKKVSGATSKSSSLSSKVIKEKEDGRKSKTTASLMSSSKNENTNKNVTELRKNRKTIAENKKGESIKRTKYFPSKDLISNVVRTERNKKIQQQNVDNNEEEENRPRTATLKKATVPNLVKTTPPNLVKTTPPNLVKRTATKTTTLTPQIPSQHLTKQKLVEELNYEDDFDSYEESDDSKNENMASCGSNCSSTSSPSPSSSSSLSETSSIERAEESKDNGNNNHLQQLSLLSSPPLLTTPENLTFEHKMDSGNFDLQDAIAGTSSTSVSLSDEGYHERGQHYDFMKSIRGGLKEEVEGNKTRNRGEEILKMIKLDKFYHTTFEMLPISYGNFIKIYGQTYGVQTPSQTATPLENQSLQTDSIDFKTKWAQIPVTFSNKDSFSKKHWNRYREEYYGVGVESEIDDRVVEDTNDQENDPHRLFSLANSNRLKKFLRISSKTVIALINNNNNMKTKCLCHSSHTNNNSSDKSGPFVSVSAKTCTNYINILKNTFIVDLYIKPTAKRSNNQHTFVTIHQSYRCGDDDDGTSKKKISVSYVCIWNALSFQEPVGVLSTPGQLTCIDLGYDGYNDSDLIFAGYKDGTVGLWWDETDQCYNNGLPPVEDNNNTTYRTKINGGHEAKVSDIRFLPNNELEKQEQDVEYGKNSQNERNKVCSLDEEGILIFWGTVVIKTTKMAKKQQQDDRFFVITLVKNYKVDLNSVCCSSLGENDFLEYKKIHFNKLNAKHLYITTGSDKILHCLTTGAKPFPKYYTTKDFAVASCMDCCPFSSVYFIVGYKNGSVALFSRKIQRPLIVFTNEANCHNNTKGKRANIDMLQWSSEKPCIFYAKDEKNVLHSWNLTLSDIFPIYSIPFKENIVSMKISKSSLKIHRQFMVIVTNDQNIWVNFFNNDHESLTNEEYESDVRYFFNYVNRL